MILHRNIQDLETMKEEGEANVIVQILLLTAASRVTVSEQKEADAKTAIRTGLIGGRGGRVLGVPSGVHHIFK